MSRLYPRRFVGETAAVRLVDQRQEQVPAICVKTGVPTDGAVRVRACDLRCAHQIDLVAGTTATVVLSVIVMLLGPWMRYHSCANHWISLRCRPERGDVISIVGVHPRFAGAARELFVTSVRQHPDSG